MAIVNKYTLKSYFQTGDTPTQSNWEDFIDTLFNGWDRMPKISMLHISQSGTNIPEGIQSINQIGSFTISRISAGRYIFVLDTPLSSLNSTYLSIIPSDSTVNSSIIIDCPDVNTITLWTKNAETGIREDNMLDNTPIIIKMMNP